MSQQFLVRARLRQHLAAAALAPLLVPEGVGERVGAAHRLVWSLFADHPDRKRDFLWRETTPGAFYILSPRPPEDRSGLFNLDPPKLFAPVLAPGQNLRFSLRANPVISVGQGGKGRGKRHDVITRALSRLPAQPDPELRRAQRSAAAQTAARGWLEYQGKRSGFEIGDELQIDSEQWVRIPRASGPPVTFLAVDFDGILTVREPGSFITALSRGFGAAKAFGSGLMLIRRVRG